MKSWKARLLILTTMLMMLVAAAVPATADDWDWYCVDYDEDGECEEWLLCYGDDDDGWRCYGPFDAPDDGDDDDDGSADPAAADDGSGGSGYYYGPYYWGY